MIKPTAVFLAICLVLGGSFFVEAQEKVQKSSLPTSVKKSTIDEFSKRLNDFYVSPEVAEKTSEHLGNQLKAGYFDSFETFEAFAESLTKEARLISKDKHLLVRPVLPLQASENSAEAIFERHMRRLEGIRNRTGGFKEAKILDGNVGYLDVRSFAVLNVGKSYADSYMQLLANSDAIIIDLRDNGGGLPEMVQYLCSYFFDKKVHLNSLYWRQGDRTDEFWSLDKVGGEKLPDVPLFVLTSPRTFSGAEEFSYNMQTQKRATLVGQTTRGGANPGRLMRLNDKLEVFIPTGKAINPITKTNWEGVGVVPDVKTSPAETLEEAHKLAKAAAKDYRERVTKNLANLSTVLIDSLESFDPQTGADVVYENLRKCKNAGLLESGMINGIGYEYLMNFKKPKVAEAVFRANTLLYPESANAFDSYGEVLVANGKRKEAAKNYQKAVDIAKETSDPDLEMFEGNLNKALQPDEKPLDSGEKISDFVRRIFQDQQGNMWFGTNGDGVVQYDGKDLKYFSIKEGFGGVAVRGIVGDKAGNVWFGTERGITKYDGKTFTNFTREDGLVGNDVWSIVIDSKGIIWIGTLEGLSCFDGKMFTPFALPEGKPDPARGVTSAKIVHSIMEDSKGRMWFGTNGGAYIFDGDSLTNLSEKDGLCNNDVNCILEDKRGNIWFATHHNGVCRYDGKSFTHVTEKDGVHGTEVWDLYQDKSGNVWFPIENSGVYRFDGESFSNFQQAQGLTTNAIQCSYEDSEGRFWVGGWQGLFRYDGESFFKVGKNGPWK